MREKGYKTISRSSGDFAGWSLPHEKPWPTWTGFCNRVSDSHFRRQFRMSCNAFTSLCTILCTAVGKGTFRPEHAPWSTVNAASLQGHVGLFAGEVKVAPLLQNKPTDHIWIWCLSLMSACCIFTQFVMNSVQSHTFSSMLFHKAMAQACVMRLIFSCLSSCSRILIEWEFGKLVMRWGILWRTLHFDLHKCQRIVQVCMFVVFAVAGQQRSCFVVPGWGKAAGVWLW